jgi:hypothetical protein
MIAGHDGLRDGGHEFVEICGLWPGWFPRALVFGRPLQAQLIARTFLALLLAVAARWLRFVAFQLRRNNLWSVSTISTYKCAALTRLSLQA